MHCGGPSPDSNLVQLPEAGIQGVHRRQCMAGDRSECAGTPANLGRRRLSMASVIGTARLNLVRYLEMHILRRFLVNSVYGLTPAACSDYYSCEMYI